MRFKDESKQQAIIEATIKLVNEIGFTASSVAKIASEANVSPATLYIYYENKEDLLLSTYLDFKKEMGTTLVKSIDESLPVRDILENLWHCIFDYISQNRAHFEFAEQFASSTFAELVNQEEVDKYFEPIFRVLQRGIDQKIIKNVSFEILSTFIFYPALFLSNPRLCRNFEFSQENIEITFTLVWDAIKL